MKRKLFIALQAAVSLALLAWMFREPEFRREASEVLVRADPWWTAVALGSAGAGALLGIARWAIFLRITGIEISRWQTFRMGAVGLFFNNFLPGAVGGDAVKAAWLAARGHPMPAAALSAVMDRLSGMSALIIFSFVFMGLRWSWLMQSSAVAALAHILVLYLAGALLLIGLSFVAASRGALERLPRRLPGRALLLECGATYSLFLSRWTGTLAASGLSLAMLGLYFLTFYCSARAMGLALPFTNFFALMPIVDLVAALPVSLGGFGVREGVFLTLLGQLFEVPAALAISVSLLGALANMAWGCLGLLLLPSYRREIHFGQR